MDRFFPLEKQRLAIQRKTRVAASQQALRAHWLLPALLAGLAGCAPLTTRMTPGMQAEAWITTNDRRLELAHEVLPPGPTQADAQGARTTITIEADQRYQRMVGFGAALTDSSAWLLQHRLDAGQRATLLQELFGRRDGGVGFDFARLIIGASDFSLSHYSHGDTADGRPDPELRQFAITPDKDDVGAVAREALAINPGLQLMATPWSAPAWMKDTGHLVEGRLLPEYYPTFARYLLAYVDARSAQGIPIFALTVQNEPDHEPRDYPGMRFNAPERARFIRDHLGPLRDARRPALQIFDWDHNWDKPEEPLAVLADPAASRHVSAVAWHCYGGDVAAQSRVHDAHPDKDTYMTECSSGDWEPSRSGGLSMPARLVIQSSRHWARGVLLWNLALDQDNGPHAGGCDTCLGVVTVDTRSGEVTRTNDYYALAHASRFVRRDAWRIGSTPTAGGIDNVAFENADDGTRVLVVSNANDVAHTIDVRDGQRGFSYPMPAKSMGTFRWNSRAE